MIWGHLFANKTPDPRTPYRRGSLLGGRTLVIATQTRAELLYGLYSSDWGEARRTRVMARLDDTNTVPVDEEVIQTYARLNAACKAGGHGLHAKEHRGDLWIAATTILISGTLLTLDKVYRNAPGLVLLSPEPPG
jgi:predicted nucleic acid-binding protein